MSDTKRYSAYKLKQFLPQKNYKLTKQYLTKSMQGLFYFCFFLKILVLLLYLVI